MNKTALEGGFYRLAFRLIAQLTIRFRQQGQGVATQFIYVGGKQAKAIKILKYLPLFSWGIALPDGYSGELILMSKSIEASSLLARSAVVIGGRENTLWQMCRLRLSGARVLLDQCQHRSTVRPAPSRPRSDYGGFACAYQRNNRNVGMLLLSE